MTLLSQTHLWSHPFTLYNGTLLDEYVAKYNNQLRERGKRIFLTCVVRDILWSKKRGRENSRWGDCLKMVADVVRFYKWIFLDFGLQNYSIGNKDVLPFFLFIPTRDQIYSTQFDPEKKTHNAFSTKIM